LLFSLVRHEHSVGYHAVEIVENNAHARDYRADRIPLKVDHRFAQDAREHGLMEEGRRRGYVDVSVDQFITITVFRDIFEIGDGRHLKNLSRYYSGFPFLTAQRRYLANSLRCFHVKSQNTERVIDEASIPDHVSIRHFRYGLSHGCTRYPFPRRQAILKMPSTRYGALFPVTRPFVA